MATISQTVNIEMLEKLPDGTYKKKNPATVAGQVTQDSSNRFVTDTEKSTWNAKPTTANVNTAIQNAIGNAIAASY